MRRLGGNLTVTSVDGATEYDTCTCVHCNGIVVMAGPVEQLGGFCQMCMGPTCRKPACNSGCRPFERQLEAWERKGANR